MFIRRLGGSDYPNEGDADRFSWIYGCRQRIIEIFGIDYNFKVWVKNNVIIKKKFTCGYL